MTIDENKYGPGDDREKATSEWNATIGKIVPETKGDETPFEQPDTLKESRFVEAENKPKITKTMKSGVMAVALPLIGYGSAPKSVLEDNPLTKKQVIRERSSNVVSRSCASQPAATKAQASIACDGSHVVQTHDEVGIEELNFERMFAKTQLSVNKARAELKGSSKKLDTNGSLESSENAKLTTFNPSVQLISCTPKGSGGKVKFLIKGKEPPTRPIKGLPGAIGIRDRNFKHELLATKPTDRVIKTVEEAAKDVSKMIVKQQQRLIISAMSVQPDDLSMLRHWGIDVCRSLLKSVIDLDDPDVKAKTLVRLKSHLQLLGNINVFTDREYLDLLDSLSDVLAEMHESSMDQIVSMEELVSLLDKFIGNDDRRDTKTAMQDNQVLDRLFKRLRKDKTELKQTCAVESLAFDRESFNIALETLDNLPAQVANRINEALQLGSDGLDCIMRTIDLDASDGLEVLEQRMHERDQVMRRLIVISTNKIKKDLEARLRYLVCKPGLDMKYKRLVNRILRSVHLLITVLRHTTVRTVSTYDQQHLTHQGKLN